MRRKNRIIGLLTVMTVLCLAACGEVPNVQEASENAEMHTEEGGGQNNFSESQ